MHLYQTICQINIRTTNNNNRRIQNQSGNYVLRNCLVRCIICDVTLGGYLSAPSVHLFGEQVKKDLYKKREVNLKMCDVFSPIQTNLPRLESNLIAGGSILVTCFRSWAELPRGNQEPSPMHPTDQIRTPQSKKIKFY